MREFLEHCHDCPKRRLAAGDVLIEEQGRSGQLFVLAEGMLEVYRGEVEIALIDEPGALFGEMAVLLDRPHTASVRAASEAVVHVIEDAEAFLADRPALAMPIARLLARRLQNVTSYLVDLKRQFADRSDHLGMVDEVLESLSHEQGEGFLPADELPPEPSSGRVR
jgi:CRP/FNR family transcriptional regulator, cyclic AMP receptor protein